MCQSGTRVLVHRSLLSEFVERICADAAKIKVGDPMDPMTTFGPLINAVQRDRALRYIEVGKSEGARVDGLRLRPDAGAHVLAQPARQRHPLSGRGAEAGHHALTHDEPGEQPQVNAIVIQIMQDFAYFIESLRAVPEGDGTLLDNSVILGTIDVSYARTHQIHEYPTLIAGTCCGALRNGFHYRSVSRESVTHVPLTIVRARGAALSEFGGDEGRVTGGLSQLEA